MPLARRHIDLSLSIAAVWFLLSAALWLLLRSPHEVAATQFTGWLAVLLPASAVAVILREAACCGISAVPPPPSPPVRILFRLHVSRLHFPPEISAALAILLIGGTGAVGWAACFRAALLFAAWLWLCGGIARGTLRLGIGPAVVISVIISMAMLAAPVIFSPALHAASGSRTQHILATCFVYACPALGEISSLLPNIHTDWSVLPGMYAYSGLGQEIPASLPIWWLNMLLFTSAALALNLAPPPPGLRLFCDGR